MRIAIVLLCLLLALPAWGQTVINGTRVIRGDLSVDGDIDIGTIETFSEDDPTPDVSDGSYFNTGVNDMTTCTADCITDFDGTPADGDIIVVNSQGAITFDCTGQGLDCGTTDIATAAGDVTMWLYDGTDWNLIAFADQSDDLGTDAGAAGGDSVSIDSVAVVDPDFVSTGQVDFTDTANTVTADINDDTILEADLKAVDAAGDEECLTFEATGGDFEWQSCASETNDLEANDPPNVADTEVYIGTGPGTGAWAALSSDVTMTNAGVVTIQDDSVQSDDIESITQSLIWNAGAISADGTQCADAAEVTLGSGPIRYTIICADNDAGIIYGDTPMPDCYETADDEITFELTVLNDNATPAGDYDIDFAVQCRGNSDVVNNTYGSEVAADVDFDAAGTCGGSACVTNELAAVTTSDVTGNGACVAGDVLFWKGSLDATGTTATVADVHILSVKMEYECTVGD